MKTQYNGNNIIHDSAAAHACQNGKANTTHSGGATSARNSEAAAHSAAHIGSVRGVRALDIGGVTLQNNVLIAPLAGYTDVGFRHIMRLLGAGLTYTEMVSAKGLKYGSQKTELLLARSPLERPCAVQIFGSDPDIMAEIVASGQLSGFDIIDINMGCPMGKIIGNGEGCALMQNPQLAEKIVTACVNAAGGRPVTVKFRAGIDEQSKTAPEFARRMEGAGASAVTVHGRTLRQLYTGRADRQIIAQTVDAVNIPVIANGDIDSVQSAEDMFNVTGAAGIMLARGALQNVLLPALITGARKVHLPTPGELALIHMDILGKHVPDRAAALGMRKTMAYYLRKVPGARPFRERVNSAYTLQDMKDIVKQAFDIE